MNWPWPRPALAPSYDARHPTYSHPPGPARGLLARFRQLFGGWLGPRLAHDTPAADHVRREKLAAQPRGVVLPNFLPYFDDQTGETPEMRRYYRRMLAAPEVKSALCGKVFGVLAQELKIVPADRHSARDREVADFVRWTLTERCKGGFPALGWNILVHGLVDGYSVCERVVRPEEKGRFAGKWPLVDLKPKQVGDDLVLQTDEYKNVVGLLGLRYNGGQEFDPSDFHLFTFEPLYGQSTGMSDFRAAYGRWWMLDTVLKLRAMGLEKRALPLLVGEYTDSVTNKPSLEAALALARSQSWISVPQGAKVTAVGIAGQADDAFRTAVQDLKHDIFLAIQGAILQSLEGAADSERGNSQVHQSTADLFRWFLSETLVASLNDRDGGLIAAIVDLNYVVDEYPRAVLASVDVGEMKAEVDLDKVLIANGLEISKEDAYRRYGRLPPNDPRDVLKPAAKGQPGGGAAPFAERGKKARSPSGGAKVDRHKHLHAPPGTPAGGEFISKKVRAAAAAPSTAAPRPLYMPRGDQRAGKPGKQSTKTANPATGAPKPSRKKDGCPNPEALRTVGGLSKNGAKAAVRKLRLKGKRGAVKYLIEFQHLSAKKAAAAVQAGSTPPKSVVSKVPKGKRPRRFFMGDNPGPNGPVGQAVFQRMLNPPEEGVQPTARVDPKTKAHEILSTHPLTGVPAWYPRSECELGHIEDAVVYWNREGKYYDRPGGRVAPEIRAHQNDPETFAFEHRSHNAIKGGLMNKIRFEEHVGGGYPPRAGRRGKRSAGTARHAGVGRGRRR